MLNGRFELYERIAGSERKVSPAIRNLSTVAVMQRPAGELIAETATDSPLTLPTVHSGAG
ncbi:MAG: hypothetical protein QMD10_09565 [Desulfitobacteriaceae bacterium]|nr:hypothetical protein [Desulfitobacteriaceae bacterium]